MIDLDTAHRALVFVSLVVSLCSAAYAFFATRRKDVDRRFDEGSKRMDRHDLRLQAVEQAIQTMPGKDDMHRLELHLSEMSGDMKAMSATMMAMAESQTRTERIVSRHEDHLRGTT
ncbi:DUF2730 family protein [Chachezhania sediminis]|uniref:DUF2730 family protein n=1 Tax=Chachezhania sediminis TaxID=2599291 RepID=UPI00131B04EA|nr:DUF2730 family protein [Chachezhania sediminis]